MDEIGETKTPNPGEWWLRNYDGAIVFICGADPDGDPVFMDDDEELRNSTLRFFTQEYHHEPLCTGFDWVEPPAETVRTIDVNPGDGYRWLEDDEIVTPTDEVFRPDLSPCWVKPLTRTGYMCGDDNYPVRRKMEPVAIDPGEGYELLPVGTVLEKGDEYLIGEIWVSTGNEGKDSVVCNIYRRKIEPVAEVWPKWYVTVIPSSHYYRIESSDIAWCISSDEETDGADAESLMCNPDVWLEVTESEALARFLVDPNDIPLNPVPGKVVATGTVKLTPVQPDDWVEFDPAQITCPRVGIDWLTLRLGESQWGPSLLVWSNATWTAQREIWKIRCRRCDLPVQPDNMVAIIAEHTTQVRELTQRIGDLVQQVNKCHAVIEGIRTALHVDFI